MSSHSPLLTQQWKFTMDLLDLLEEITGHNIDTSSCQILRTLDLFNEHWKII
jgi:hypothetical protein